MEVWWSVGLLLGVIGETVFRVNKGERILDEFRGCKERGKVEMVMIGRLLE